MRTLTLLTLLGAATVSASAFAAPPTANVDTANSTLMSVQTISAAKYKLTPVEFKGVQGRYTMDNGQMLQVSEDGHKLFAEIGNTRSELLAVAENTFVARDADMKLVFDQIPFATEVVLTKK